MTEPQVDEAGHAVVVPTMPGVVLVNVTHPDDPPPTCTATEARAEPRTLRWRCPRCPAHGKARGGFAALAAVLEHEPTCPGDPAVAAARARARDSSRKGRR